MRTVLGGDYTVWIQMAGLGRLLRGCYRWNVSVPHKIYLLNPNPKVMVLGGDEGGD